MNMTIAINANNSKFNAHFEARAIIQHHTCSVMNCGNYNPMNEDELYDFMLEECAYILTENFLDGRFTPMEYNAIRNELAQIIFELFNPEYKRSSYANYNDGRGIIDDNN